MGHHLLRDDLRFPHPGLARQRVPGDLHRLILFQRAELRLVDKCPHANLVQVRHLRQQIPQLHVVPGFHRQRVQRSIRRRGDSPLPHLFIERRYFILDLLHVQPGLVRVQLHSPVKLLFRRRQPCHFRLRFRQGQVVRRELVFCRGLLLDQPLQPFLILLQPVALRLGFC